MKGLLIADTAVVVVFAASGRSSHDEGLDPVAVLGTAWPFLVGLGAGWLLTKALARTGAGRTAGELADSASTWLPSRVGGYLVILGATVGGGMLLRQLTGAGTATAFIIVAVGFNAIGFAAVRAPGWYRMLRDRRAAGSDATDRVPVSR